jgi:phage FluMu protein Com
MPIQFRCNYCNQLLSIATRKAGAVVGCPTCAARIIVPRRSEAAKVGQSAKVEVGKGRDAAGKADHGSLLEQGDFEELLKAPEPVHDRPEPVAVPGADQTEKAPSSSSNSSVSEAPPGQDINVELVASLPVTGTALVLTPGRASILAVAVVILAALAFLAGLWVGRAG